MERVFITVKGMKIESHDNYTKIILKIKKHGFTKVEFLQCHNNYITCSDGLSEMVFAQDNRNLVDLINFYPRAIPEIIIKYYNEDLYAVRKEFLNITFLNKNDFWVFIMNRDVFMGKLNLLRQKHNK